MYRHEVWQPCFSLFFFFVAQAQSLGLRPKAVVRDVAFASADPREDLMLGAAYAVAKLLRRTGRKLSGAVWRGKKGCQGMMMMMMMRS